MVHKGVIVAVGDGKDPAAGENHQQGHRGKDKDDGGVLGDVLALLLVSAETSGGWEGAMGAPVLWETTFWGPFFFLVVAHSFNSSPQPVASIMPMGL